jgi:hypothetical protein
MRMERQETMVERVAKAIAETLMEIDQKRAENSGHDIMLVIDAYMPTCRLAARAAIDVICEKIAAVALDRGDEELGEIIIAALKERD